MLVQEDEKRRQLAGRVVLLNPLGQCGQISVDDLRERSRVENASGDRWKIVDPEDVVVARLTDHPEQFPVKLQIGHIGKTIVAGQRRFGRALQQVVQFVLFVVLLGQEAVLQWQPD